MKKLLLVVGFALALGACAAQQTALQSADTPAAEQEAAAQEKAAASKRSKRMTRIMSASLERRDVTGIAHKPGAAQGRTSSEDTIAGIQRASTPYPRKKSR